MRSHVAWIVLAGMFAGGCADELPPQRFSGSTLLLNAAPSNRPAFAGGAAYDFDLLEQTAGRACAEDGDTSQYWIGLNDLGQLSPDATTRQAIAAAALDAIARMDEADTIVITRVVADSKSAHRVCASVIGRGVRLTKSGAPSTAAKPTAPGEAERP